MTNVLGEVAVTHRDEKSKSRSRKPMWSKASQHPDETTLFLVTSQDDELGVDRTRDGVTEGKG